MSEEKRYPLLLYDKEGELFLKEKEFEILADKKSLLKSSYENVISIRRIKVIRKKQFLVLLSVMTGAALFFMIVIIIGPIYWYVGVIGFLAGLLADVILSKKLSMDGLMLIGRKKVINFIPKDIETVQEELRKKVFLSREFADSAEAERLRAEALERVKKRGLKIKKYREKKFKEWQLKHKKEEFSRKKP